VRFTPAHDLIEATWDTGAFMQVSGVLKRTAAVEDLQRPAIARERGTEVTPNVEMDAAISSR
jgi:hypothetical protein